jgi:hypothetical protein
LNQLDSCACVPPSNLDRLKNSFNAPDRRKSLALQLGNVPQKDLVLQSDRRFRNIPIHSSGLPRQANVNPRIEHNRSDRRLQFVC